MLKRKHCLIEEVTIEEINHIKRVIKSIEENMEATKPAEAWRNALDLAEKSVILENKLRKVHYKFRDGKQMVEEYNEETSCLSKRMWKAQGGFNVSGEEAFDDWIVEIGENPARKAPGAQKVELNLQESNDQPIVSRRNTRINLEWRIRNLPYPIETYSISGDAIERCLIVRTSNKKYFKKLPVLELERIGIDVEQNNINFTHKFNTLIITYKKPSDLIEFEKSWYNELKKIQPMKNDIDACKPS